MTREREAFDGAEDEAYENWRQRLVDAWSEGRQAGLKLQSAEMNPYFTFEPEYNEWHHGRLEGLSEHVQRRAA